MKKLSYLPFLALIFALTSGNAFAECISCISASGASYTEVACTGNTKFEVITKCGQPDFLEEGDEVTTGVVTRDGGKGKSPRSFSAITERIDRLYYNCGDGRFVRVLIFRGGRLVSIQEGGRGSGTQRCW